MTEQVAIVDASASAEPAHGVPKLRVDECVDHYGGMAAGAEHGPLEVCDGLRPRVTHLLERLLGKLGLEGEHEARGSLSRRVGHDVELDGRLLRHPGHCRGYRPLPCPTSLAFGSLPSLGIASAHAPLRSPRVQRTATSFALKRPCR